MVNKDVGAEKWQAEQDLKTLIEAEKIKKDKARYKAAMAERKALLDNLSKVEEK